MEVSRIHLSPVHGDANAATVSKRAPGTEVQEALKLLTYFLSTANRSSARFQLRPSHFSLDSARRQSNSS